VAVAHSITGIEVANLVRHFYLKGGKSKELACYIELKRRFNSITAPPSGGSLELKRSFNSI